MWQWKSNNVAMEEQPCGNGRATMRQWKSNHVAMEEQPSEKYQVANCHFPALPLPQSALLLAMEEQPVANRSVDCGNGRAGKWQWKRKTLAVEKQHFGIERVKKVLGFQKAVKRSKS